MYPICVCVFLVRQEALSAPETTDAADDNGGDPGDNGGDNNDAGGDGVDTGGDDAAAVDMYGSAGPRDLPDGGNPGGEGANGELAEPVWPTWKGVVPRRQSTRNRCSPRGREFSLRVDRMEAV
jgi:hypothetical protein